jgi:hypothetical protein
MFFPAFRLIGLIWPRDADVEMEAYKASKGKQTYGNNQIE